MKLVEIKNIKAKPLHEAYRTPIKSLDDLKALLNKHCGDALKTFSTPIVRGMRDGGDFLILRGEDGHRESRNTSNYYTRILDHVLGEDGFPLRSKSIICASWPNQDHAALYGPLHMLFPMNDVPIGVCQGPDIFTTKITLGGKELYIHEFNDEFEREGVDSSSFDRIVSDLEHLKDTEEDDAVEWLQNISNVESELATEYAAPFGLTDTSDPWYNDSKHELWIGGTVICMSEAVYAELLNDQSWINH